MFRARVHQDYFSPPQIEYLHYSKGVLDASTCSALIPARLAHCLSKFCHSYIYIVPPALWPVQSRACVRRPGRLIALYIPTLIITKAISIHTCTKYTPNLFRNVSCTHPPSLLSTSPNLVFALPSRSPGCMLNPHSGLVSPPSVTVLSLIPYVNTTLWPEQSCACARRPGRLPPFCILILDDN